MNIKRFLCFCTAALMAAALLSGCSKNRDIPGWESITPKNGSSVSGLNADMADFYRNFEVGYSLEYAREEDNYLPDGLKLTWTEKEGTRKCEVLVADNEKLENADKFVTLDDSLLLENYYLGRNYYWQVTYYFENGSETSPVFTFETLRDCRTVSIGGVTNTRDFGGHKTVNGKVIRQGMIYRGANLDSINDQGRYDFGQKLGIKTDLDLRASGEGTAGNGKGSPAGADIRYVNISAPLYTQIGKEDYQEAFAEEIRLFTDENNYPIYFHCAIGRDRTGTLAFMLGAILGLSEKDLYREYETSIFSRYGGNDPLGMLKNNFTPLIDYVKTFEGKTLQQQAENYLKSIGITAEEIEAIRTIMLEG